QQPSATQPEWGQTGDKIALALLLRRWPTPHSCGKIYPMASIERRGKSYRVVFRLDGQKHARSLGTRSEKVAVAALLRLEDNLRRVQLGTLVVPSDADPAVFLLSDGAATNVRSKPEITESHIRTLKKLLDSYMESLPDSSIEDSTRYGLEIHFRHLNRELGTQFPLKLLDLEALQGYVNKRSKAKGKRGKPLSATTIKKEVSSLNTVWSWALRHKHVSHPLPVRDLRYPKSAQRPPFQTMQEVQRKMDLGGLENWEIEELWDSVFLTTDEIAELLAVVEARARHPFIYPMFAFAAHTGARRSEIVRCQIHDVDIATRQIAIREKKRVRGQRSTRTVPISRFLVDVLSAWLQQHPSSIYLFPIQPQVLRSTKQRAVPMQLTLDEATHHFQRTLSGTQWQRIRGWHVFRHSFCSNCASAGVDQRLIDAWVGHQTEEMRRRYRHLIPSTQLDAIGEVFGDSSSAATNSYTR
ncbi:MAG: site-specific integrase, partial [bacterium]|nr:site-specific integrase [bacterium]